MFHPKLKSLENASSCHPYYRFFSNQKQVAMPTQGDNQSMTPRYEAVQQLRFLVLSCNGWSDSLSNPVTALELRDGSVFNDVRFLNTIKTENSDTPFVFT